MQIAPRDVSCVISGLVLIALCATQVTAEDLTPAHEYNKLLDRGVNLGNALDAPKEGEWGFRLKAEYFGEIQRAGFNSVRLPVRWSAHAKSDAPYTIDPEFMARVDWAVEQATKNKLFIVLNVHHYEELFETPDQHEARLVALWRQIAEHFRDRSDLLSFELLNEPHGKLTHERWQALFPKVLAVVRESNPRRFVIIGPGDWNNSAALEKLELPSSDKRLIATFHYYSPFEFTHQGASWVPGSDRWKGKTWTASADEMAAIERDFDRVAAWARKHDRPIFLGEFGSFSAAEMESRAHWTRTIARQAERRGFSWSYWEFGSGFGVYNPAASTWRAPLKAALVDEPAK